MGHPGAGRRGQLQPAEEVPAATRPDQHEGGKGDYRERVDDAGDEQELVKRRLNFCEKNNIFQ